MSEYLELLQNADFLFPSALWLLALVPILLLIGLLRNPRRFLSHILRTTALGLLILALANPVTTERSAVEELAAVVDLSYSIPQRARNAFAQELERFVKDRKGKLTLLPFARNTASKPTVLAQSSSSGQIAEALDAAAGKLDTGETNIASALSSALSQTSSSSILLLSDGQETTEDALQIARLAAKKGVKIFSLVPDNELFLREKLAISSVHAPVTAHAGDKTEVRVTVANSYSEPVNAELQVWLDKEKLFSQNMSFPAGQEKLVTLKTPTLEGGLQRLRAVLRRPDVDQGRQPEERHRWISVKEKEKILMISGTAEDERVLKDLIRAKGYGLTHIVADGNEPIPTSFESFSSVILNNAARTQLPREFLPALQKFVESGAGLLILGGDRSFGLGNYIDTPLDEMSPLKFLPPQTKKRRLTVAVVLVMDKSGSMAHQNKIEAAKSAASQSIAALKDDDFIGVIGFDHAPFVIIPLKQVAEVRDQAERRLRNLTAAGKTNLLPALAAARQSLKNSSASRKHIIVMSDGKIPLASDVYVEEINRLRSDGVSVSAVALGIEADVPFLKLLAKYGKGVFYHTLDATRLPQIFVHDIKVSTGEETMQENQEFPIGIGPAGTVTTSLSRFPHLLGFVETMPKKGSSLELITRKGSKIHPILGSWNYGRGKVVAYTSDANGRWSSPWLRWPGFPKFWGELIDSIKDRSGGTGNEIDFDLRYRVNRGAVLLDLAIFDEKLRSQSAPQITAKVLEAGGEPSNITFRPVKKGRFEAVIENGRPGDYRVEINYGGLKLPPLALTLSGEAFGESPGKGVNLTTLEQVAYLSGGMVNPEPAQVQGHQRIAEKTRHLYVPLVILGFILVLLDVFFREAWTPSLRRRRHTESGKVRVLKPRGEYDRRQRRFG